MYHRFNEKKYPSTNINIDIFKQHLKIIEDNNYSFYNPSNFVSNFNIPKKQKNILITIDDAFISFYNNAWPILKKKKYRLFYLFQQNL